MGSCLFCQIAEGKEDAQRLKETESAVAFLDINPLTDGHTVVIPKEHYERASEVPSNQWAQLMELSMEINQAIQDSLGSAGANIGLNDGKPAGQAIPHVHLHLIPRYKNDGGGSFHSIINMETTLDLDNIEDRICSNL